MTMRRLAGLAAGFCLAAIAPSQAAGTYLAGASGGVSYDYAFAGAIVPLTDNPGPAVRIWADHLDYDYIAGSGGKIQAAGWGGAVAGVYQFSGAWGWTNLSAGVDYRNTLLSAPDPGNQQRGSHGYFAAQADGGLNLDEDWRVTGLASYTPDTHGYLTQAGLDRAVATDVRLGLVGTLQGDKNYQQVAGGVTAYFQVTPALQLAPFVGGSKSGKDSGVYGGVTLVFAPG